MANPEHVKILKQGVKVWNRWRAENSNITPDLRKEDLQNLQLEGANLTQAELNWSDLRNAILQGADLSHSSLYHADLRMAKLSRANLHRAFMFEATLVLAQGRGADFSESRMFGSVLSRADLVNTNLQNAVLQDATASSADFSHANLEHAHLTGTMLAQANLSHANLRGADLRGANLVRTNLTRADLTGTMIYGISAWDVLAEGIQQNDLVISPPQEPVLTVDNLEVAQFIYLLLHNQKIRHVIDTITAKVVLILGRFSPERKVILDAIREELRKHDYLPVMFDFEKPESKTTVETVATLAGLARFVIADLTDAKSVLQELQAVVPQHPSVPVQPLLLSSQNEPGMLDSLKAYPWVRPVFEYNSQEHLLGSIGAIVTPFAPSQTGKKRP